MTRGNLRCRPRASVLLIVAAALLSSLSAAPSSAVTTWEVGDLFLGVSDGSFQVRSPDGTLKETLNHAVYMLYTTDCALDADGNLYGVFQSDFGVSRFDAAPPHAHTDVVTGADFPEGIAFDDDGNFYLALNDFLGPDDAGINLYDPNGAFIRTITTDDAVSISIANDGDTMLYTAGNSFIKRVSIETGAALPDFTGSASTGYMVRALRDGTVLLADAFDIKRFDASGAVMQTYDVEDVDGWYGLALDPDLTSFWATDAHAGIVHRFDIEAGGAPLASIDAGVGSDELFGVCVKGEPSAYVPPPQLQACLYGGTLSQAGHINEGDTPTVACGRGESVVLEQGEDYYACLYAGALSQVGTEPPASCGRGEAVTLAMGEDLHGCLYAGRLSQLGYSEPASCGRGEHVGLALGML